MRHGERTDFSGEIPKLGYLDPEMTKKGCEQAYQMGMIISKEISNLNYDNNGKIILISSPWARTLQTSNGVLSALSDENCNGLQKEIHIDHLLGEIIDKKEYIEELPKNYLTLYNNHELILSNVGEINLKYLNFKENLPVVEENHEICYKRSEKCIENTKNDILINDDVNIVILISHGTPIDNMNKILGFPGPFGFSHIKYCNSYFYSHDSQTNATEYLFKKEL